MTSPAPAPRRFTSISRTVLPDGRYILDAIDDEGVAWWMDNYSRWILTLPLPHRGANPELNPPF